MYRTHAQSLWTRSRPEPAARVRGGRRDRQRHRSGEPALRHAAGGECGVAPARRRRSARRCSCATGAGLVLTSRGRACAPGCIRTSRGSIDAALAPPTFDPRTSRSHAPHRALRLGGAVAVAAADQRARARGAEDARRRDAGPVPHRRRRARGRARCGGHRRRRAARDIRRLQADHAAATCASTIRVTRVAQN